MPISSSKYTQGFLRNHPSSLILSKNNLSEHSSEFSPIVPLGSFDYLSPGLIHRARVRKDLPRFKQRVDQIIYSRPPIYRDISSWRQQHRRTSQIQFMITDIGSYGMSSGLGSRMPTVQGGWRALARHHRIAEDWLCYNSYKCHVFQVIMQLLRMVLSKRHIHYNHCH